MLEIDSMEINIIIEQTLTYASPENVKQLLELRVSRKQR